MPITPADSLDLLIAKGPPDTKGLADQIANLPNAYWSGLDEAYKRRTQDAFQGGVPTIKGPNGEDIPDYNAAAITALRLGGTPAVAPFATLAGLDIKRQEQLGDITAAKVRAGDVVPGAPPSTSDTSLSPPTARITVQPTSVPSRPLSPSQASPNAETSAISAIPSGFGDREGYSLATGIVARLNAANPGAPPITDLNAPLSPQQFAQAQQMAQQAAASRGLTQPNAPITRPPVAAVPAGIDPNSPIPPRWQGHEAEYLQALRRSSATGTEKGRAQTEATIKAVEDYMTKNADIERGARTKEGEKNVDSLSKLADDGIDARAHTAQLEEIRRLGQKAGYGVIPKIQSVLGRYGIETKGLGDIQAYERAIDFFGPQLRPVGSGRLLQNELTSFKSALGGLMTTPQGRELSISNLQLLSKYKEDVGRIAADTRLPAAQRIQQIYDVAVPHLQTAVGPAVGTKRNGYTFKGGDPNSPASWIR
jgi:hypothetical protein